MREDRERLQDILDAVAQVEKYASRGRAVFETNELVQTWIVHHLLIIGEAVRGLTDALKHRYAGIPWPLVVGMRNIIVHEYFMYDLNEVWRVVEKDLPDLKQKVEAILKNLPEAG